jgi:hypothetical protein
MYCAQTIVATASTVPAIVLKMLEERTDQFGIQILHLQVTGLAPVMF